MIQINRSEFNISMKIDSRQERQKGLERAGSKNPHLILGLIKKSRDQILFAFCPFFHSSYLCVSIFNLFQFATLLKIHQRTHTHTFHWFPFSFVCRFLLHFVTSSSSSSFISLFCSFHTTSPPNHYQLYLDINTFLKMVLVKQNLCIQFQLSYSVCAFVLFCFSFFSACMRECVCVSGLVFCMQKSSSSNTSHENVSQMSLLLFLVHFIVEAKNRESR